MQKEEKSKPTTKYNYIYGMKEDTMLVRDDGQVYFIDKEVFEKYASKIVKNKNKADL